MLRTNSIEIRVDAPTKGLNTRTPSDMQDDGKSQFLTAAENVRAEMGELKAAPGYERVHTTPKTADDTLTGEPNLIHQPNLTSSDVEVQKLPIIGTETGLYTMAKRARNLICPVDCTLRFAAIADFGKVSGAVVDVARMIRGWDPDVVVAAGDLVYPDGGTAATDDVFETQVAQHFWWAIGGYRGPYGTGPDQNKFLPAVGNHDYDDGPLDRYLSFFNLPGNERYYTTKRGPVQFFFIDSYGYGPTAPGPQGVNISGTGADPGTGNGDLSATGPQAVWLQQQLAASDCPWRVVVWHHPPETSESGYYPGYSVMNWPLGSWGADVLITGHSHVYERIHRTDGVLHLITGHGGHSLRTFVASPLATSQFRYGADYGALRFDVNSTTLTAKMFDRTGVERDSITRTTARSLSVCYVGNLSRQATQLRITPSTVSIPRRVQFPLKALAYFSDGTSADVTTSSSWQSLAPSIMSVDAAGKVTGVSAGTGTVRATYQGLIATATVGVIADCVDFEQDIALVLDRSGSMAWTNPPQGTRMERLKVAANLFLDSLREKDQVLTISFSSEVSLHHGLTSDFSQSRLAIESLGPYGQTNIADAVDMAVQDLTTNGRPNVGKVLILFTDGVASTSMNYGCAPYDPVCGLSAGTQAFDKAKAAGIKCIVVTLDLFRPYVEGIVSTWPNCPSVYFPVVDANNLGAVFVKLRNEVCVGLCGSSGSGFGIFLV